MNELTAPPAAQLLELMNGYWLTQSIAVAAELNVADALADGPLDASSLADRVGADAPSLKRLMRALATIGVFDEPEDGVFELAPLGDCLRADRPGSLRDLALMRGSGWQWRAWADLAHSVRTGETAFEHVHGESLFDWLGEHPADGAVFDRAMIGHATQMHLGVAVAYDFSGYRRIVDVGGGLGTLLRAIRERNGDAATYVLFDQPHVVESVDGIETVAGDFFESVPSGDLLLLSHVVHDWDDEAAVRILRRCREAIAAPDGRLLVCEMVVPPAGTPDFSKLLDIEMLVNTGGVERTEAEYASLLEAAGFELTRVIPTAAPTSIVEARPN
jgi:hypothetical protein